MEQYAEGKGQTPAPNAQPIGNDLINPLSPGMILTALRRRWPIIVAAFVVSIAIAVLLCIFSTRRYSATASVDLNPNGTNGSTLELIQQQFIDSDMVSTHMATQIQIMHSKLLLLRVCDRLELDKHPEYRRILELEGRKGSCSAMSSKDRDLAVANLDLLLKITVKAGTSIVQVQVTSTSPQFSMDTANIVVDSFIERDLGSAFGGTAKVSEWLTSQLDSLRDQVADAQQKLANFQKRNNLIGADESQNVLIDRLRILNQQVATAEADRISKEARYRIAQSHNPELIGAVAQNPNLGMLRTQQVQLQAQYDQLSSKFGANYPRIRELSQQIESLQKDIDIQVANVQRHFQEDYLASQKAEDALRAGLNKQEQTVYKVNENAAEYAMLRHNAESTRNLYDAIQYKLKESGIMETLHSTQIEIIDPATLPSKPVSPRVKVILLLGTLIGLALGAFIAAVLETFDDSLRSAEMIQGALHIPVLGIITHIDFNDPEAGTPGKQLNLVAVNRPKSVYAEGYRSLRSSLLLSAVDRVPRVQVITSGSESEGKSLTSSNYAITLAQQGSRVLLVDADLRRGSVHTKFNMAKTPGLTNVLSDGDFSQSVRRPIPSLPNLEVLPMGVTPPNPSELLHSQKMKDLVRSWAEQYDFVILDTAPVLPVADTLSLAQDADVVLLVARAGLTRMRALRRTVDTLRRVHAPISGVAVNDVKKSDGYYLYYGKYNYAATTEGDEE